MRKIFSFFNQTQKKDLVTTGIKYISVDQDVERFLDRHGVPFQRYEGEKFPYWIVDYRGKGIQLQLLERGGERYEMLVFPDGEVLREEAYTAGVMLRWGNHLRFLYGVTYDPENMNIVGTYSEDFEVRDDSSN